LIYAQVAAKVFWTNPNRRDAKGWTPLAVAIFCDQKKCAELLLAHGPAQRVNQTSLDVGPMAWRSPISRRDACTRRRRSDHCK
jgi:ankyrin repeat protein